MAELMNAEESQGPKEVSTQGKIFQDSVHGTIRLHPLLVKIIDTPQFQRLRNIKQMGGAYFVFPGACHNRFEHSIGTAYLAGKVARILQKQEETAIGSKKKKPVKITDVDVLCVEIAGLCHDLGHGPFSHMFDGMFAEQMKIEKKWERAKKHEELSCEMLQYLIDDNEDVKNKFEEYLGRDTEGGYQKNLTFIKEMIKPEKDSTSWPYEGREEEKSFLFDIVSNERNKVDVDKWDYFARDCHHLGMKSSFDHERFMQCLQVRKDDSGRNQICARDKECFNLYEMFHVRFTLHQRACKHRVVNVIERMICDAFIAEVKTGSEVGKILEGCMTDIEAYAELDDTIFQTILHRDRKAKRSGTLQRILNRDLYPYLGTVKPSDGDSGNETQLTCGDIARDLVRKGAKKLKTDDFALVEAKFNYGKDSSNPVDDFLFFSKKSEEEDDGQVTFHLRQKDISFMLPASFSDREVQIFWKGDKGLKKIAEDCLSKFCDDSDKFRLKQGMLTPRKKPESSHSGEDTKKAQRNLKKNFEEATGPSNSDRD